MAEGDAPAGTTGASASGPAPGTDRYAPSPAAGQGQALAGPDVFDPNATIEDPDLATRTIVKVDEVPGLGRSAPCADGGRLAERYQLTHRVGATSGGQAYTGQDLALSRPVAIKVLPAARAMDPMRRQRFFHEARTAARLEHPGIMPIHDLDQTPSGDLYFTTGHIGSTTLAEALRLAAAGSRPPCLASWRQAATVLLKTAEAVAHAHDLGIIHRDLKPEHIALGDEGEVQVGGWQWAAELEPSTGMARSGTVGTPAWMSPEQARGEPADRRSDVYALGAILFQTLTLEVPIAAGDQELFWQLKRIGRVPEPVVQRNAGAPRHLLACAMEALDPSPALRPADARAFAQALLSALDRQLSDELLSGLDRRRRRRNWMAGLAAAVVLALAASLIARPLSHWINRPPLLLSEDFTSPTLPASLRVLRGFSPTADGQLSAYTLSDGRLVSTGPFHNYIFLDRMLSGRIEVDCTARWDRSAPVGEMSLVWVPRDPFTSEHPLKESSYLQVGAWDNEYTSIYLNNFSSGIGGGRASVADFRLEPDRDYRLRFTIDGSLYRIEVDDVVVCEFRDPSVPQRSGWIGLYATRAGKQFDDLRIRADRTAMVPISAVAEAFLRDGLNDAAVSEFDRISRSLDGAMSDEARYRQGVALVQAGKPEQARAVWDAIRDPPWSEIAAVRACDLDFEAGRHDAVIATLRSLYGASPASRSLVHVAWGRYVTYLAGHGKAECDLYLALQQSLFQTDKAVRKAAASALVALGRPREAYERFPDCANEAAEALLAMGREQDVIDRYPDRLSQVERAKLNLGRLREVADGPYGSDQQLALILEGRGNEVLAQARYPGATLHGLAAASLDRWNDVPGYAPGWDASTFALLPLLAEGRYEDVLAGKPTNSFGLRASALLRLGRGDEARSAATQPGPRRQVVQWQVVDAIARGDTAQATKFRADLAKLPLPVNVEQIGWLTDLILLPLADQLAGQDQAFTTAKTRISTDFPRRWGGMAWHLMMYIDGFIDLAKLRSQPVQLMVPAMEPLGLAIRAELAGKAEEAITQWQAYLALPYSQRLWGSLCGDPAADRFARWRIDAVRR